MKESKALVVTTHMGLGHMRAAYALTELMEKPVVFGIDKDFTTEEEAVFLNRIRKVYYLFSKAMEIPFFGKYIFGILDRLMKFPGLYSTEEQKEKTLGTWLLDLIVRKRKICIKLAQKASENPEIPVVHTFYATAVAMDRLAPDTSNWLIVTDIDINRVWVAGKPEKSRIKYLVPSSRTKRRLLKYGVSNKNIFVTGFPLPVENTDSSVFSNDLAKRIVRLDVNGSFRKMYGKICLGVLGLNQFPETDSTVRIMYAIGGSGVQADMALKIVDSLKQGLSNGDFRLYISCGINRKVYDGLNEGLLERGYKEGLQNNVVTIFSEDFDEYYHRFNKALRDTDILWTKPSELSFYCGLGIALITTRPVGYHEKMNRRWLTEIHAAIKMPGRAEDCSQWLYDFLESDILAQTAWNGYLNAEKGGTRNIVKICHESGEKK